MTVELGREKAVPAEGWQVVKATMPPLSGRHCVVWVEPFDQVERNRTEAGRNTLGHDLIERLVFHYGFYEFVNTIS